MFTGKAMSGHIQKKLIPRAFGATLAVLASALLLTASGLGGAYAQETFPLEVSGQTFDVQYEITGGTVEGMSADPDTQTLAVMVDSTEDGSLTIWLPTDLIFADDEFAVIVDGESGNFVVDELTPTADASVLMIELATGAQVVEIVGTSMLGGGAVGDTFSLDIEGTSYDIQYEVTGGTVSDMSADPGTTTLLVNIETTGDGTLKIWLPTNVINADDEYSVAIDGESNNIVFDELEATDDARVLQIEFPNGAQEVEIIGTFVVPEFGVIAAIILAIAIVGVIAATSYRKLPSQRAV